MKNSHFGLFVMQKIKKGESFMKKQHIRIIDKRDFTEENYDILFNKMMLLAGKKWCDRGWLYKLGRAEDGDWQLAQYKSQCYPKNCKGCKHNV